MSLTGLDVCSRTIEILQRARIFRANYCLKVLNVHTHIKLPSPISDKQ